MAQAKQNDIYTAGKRKEAIARIKLTAAKGAMTVNDKPMSDYFTGEVAKTAYLKAFQVLSLEPENYTVSVKVAGGGKSAQLESVSKGIAKALLELNPDYRPRLKDAKLLHRDSRVRERRKYGLAQKARKQKSSPKR